MTDVLSAGRAGEFSAGGTLPLGSWACSAALDCPLWGPERGFEALTSLPGEGGNLHLKAFHPHLFAFIPCHALFGDENPLYKLSEDTSSNINQKTVQ